MGAVPDKDVERNGSGQCLGGSRRIQPEGFQRYVLAMVRHPLGISYLAGRLSPGGSLLDGAAPNTLNPTAVSWLCLTKPIMIAAAALLYGRHPH